MSARVPAVLLAVALSTGGCDLLERELPAEVPNDAQVDASPFPVVDWGVVDGLLSVRLHNNGDKTLARADALITVRLTDGATVQSGPSRDNDLCCTVLDVPPDQDFGVYVDLGLEAEQIDDVSVSYRNLAYAAAASQASPRVRAGDAELVGGDTEAQVAVPLTAQGGDVPALAGQAFLTGPDGSFLAVVSGRFACFTQGEARDVVMELYHPVPDGTTIESVVAYPLADPTMVDDAETCTE